MNMDFFQNTHLFTGRGCVRAKGGRMAQLGKRCVILTGRTAAKKCGALDDVTAVLDELGIEYKIYDNIGQNPAMAACVDAGRFACAWGADFLIGIGGGSPVDAAKAAAAIAANPGLDHAELISSKFGSAPLPVVAVGTTAGTGTEVTGVAVITDYDGEKKSLRGHCLYPVLAYGDPAYTMSLSDYFTRSTAVDALAHCVESYFNDDANEMSSNFAVRGVQLIMDVFEKIVERGTESLDYTQREKLYYGSLYGGYALTVTSTALPHAAGLVLSERHGVPHGLACGIFQPHFLAHCADVIPARHAAFFRAVGLAQECYLERLETVMPAVDVTMTAEEVESLERRWLCNGGIKRTPGSITPQMVTDMLRDMFVR